MALTLIEIQKIEKHLGGAIQLAHLARFDWKRQTDVVQEAFIVARLFLDAGRNAVFVDGQIDNRVKKRALDGGDVRRYFNRRFHDLGFKSRRVLFFDTVATRKMSGPRKRGRGSLHFHGVFELPAGWSGAQLMRLLGRVFGVIPSMGQRQFHLTRPLEDKQHSHNGVTATGTLGKLLYVVTHAGATYADLELNGGKRSRKAPASRATYNRRAHGLAQGIPSNFNSKTVLCDHASKQRGREAFEAWVKTGKAAAALVSGAKARPLSDIAPVAPPDDTRDRGEKPGR